MSEILEALRSAREDLPTEALGLALQTWPEAAPPLLAQLEAYLDGSDRSEDAQNACFFILFLMAGAREKRGFPLALRLARDAEAAEALLAESATDILTKVLIGTYDGELEALLGLARDAEVDEFIRAAALDCFCWLAATGAVPRPQAEAVLRELFASMPPQDEPGFVWDAWCQAVALLGFDSLRPEAQAVL